MKKYKIYCLLILTFISFDCLAKTTKVFSSSIEHEIDAYYSYVALFLNLTDQPIPDIGNKNEFEVYADLASRALLPRFMIVEASVYPMPILGTFIKSQYSDFYNSFNLSKESNLVDSITAGFEEPFAMTLFLGNMVKFTKSESSNTNNRGFMGFLISTGTQHIAYNSLIDDNWYEVEWKIKGDRVEAGEKLSWSFRAGLKFHDNPQIADLYYIALRRKQIGFDMPVISWLFNSGYELTLKFNQATNKPVEQSLFVDKKIPYKNWGVSFSFGLGIINTDKGKYKGSIKDNKADTLLVIRPSIEF